MARAQVRGLAVLGIAAAKAEPHAERQAQVAESLLCGPVGDEAAVDVMVDDQEAGLVETAAGSHELRNYVFTDAVLFEHAMDAPDLSFDPAKAR